MAVLGSDDGTITGDADEGAVTQPGSGPRDGCSRGHSVVDDAKSVVEERCDSTYVIGAGFARWDRRDSHWRE